MISDVASLWILVLVVTILILGLVFRKPISARIERGGFKWQRRDMSLEIEPDYDRPPTGEAEARAQETDVSEGDEPLGPEDGEPNEPVNVSTDEAPSGVEEEDRGPTYLDVIAKLREGEPHEARRIFDELFEADTMDETQSLRHKAMFAYTRFRWANDTEALDELRDASQNAEVAAFVQNLIGQAYEENGMPERALEAFEAASPAATVGKERAIAITGESRCLHALGNPDRATQRLTQGLATASDDDESRVYYVALASLFQKEEDWLSRAVALEKLLELRPNDDARRFDAGYSYSQAGSDDVALLHYRALLRNKPEHALGSNNLGVVYEGLSLPIQAVESYKLSAELEHGLGAANLANLYLNAGLAQEAKEILHKAANWDDTHPNVSSNMARALTREEEEQESIKKIVERAQREQQFNRQFAEARFVAIEPLTIAGTWVSDSGARFEFAQTKSDFEAIFEETDTRRKLTGSVSNQGLLFELFVETYSFTSTVMAFEKRGSGRGYVGADGKIHLRFNERDRDREMELGRLPS